MSELGQKRRFDPLPNHFRSNPVNGHRQTGPFGPFGAITGNNVLRGRDASYLAPPAQIRTCGFPAYGSHLGCQRRKLAVCEPTPVTRWSGTESSTCFTSPHSPRSLPFAPPTPPRIAPFCSSASQLL